MLGRLIGSNQFDVCWHLLVEDGAVFGLFDVPNLPVPGGMPWASPIIAENGINANADNGAMRASREVKRVGIIVFASEVVDDTSITHALCGAFVVSSSIIETTPVSKLLFRGAKTSCAIDLWLQPTYMP